VAVLLTFIAANLLFIISCLPFVTIPAAIAALFGVARKVARGEEPQVWPTFWRSFSENFWQSSLIGIGIFILSCLYWIDQRAVSLTRVGQLGNVENFVLTGMGLVALMVILHIFPIMVHMKLKIRHIIRNAMILTVTRPLLSLANGIIIVFLLYLCERAPLLFFIFYFSVSATITYWFVEKKWAP